MDLFTKIDQLKAALDRKDELKEQTKENNSEIAALKEEIAQMMIDAECPTISRNGFKYSLQEKVCYSKKSERKPCRKQASTSSKRSDPQASAT